MCQRCWESAAFPATESKVTTGGTNERHREASRTGRWPNKTGKGTAADLSSRDLRGSSLGGQIQPCPHRGPGLMGTHSPALREPQCHRERKGACPQGIPICRGIVVTSAVGTLPQASGPPHSIHPPLQDRTPRCRERACLAVPGQGSPPEVLSDSL